MRACECNVKFLIERVRFTAADFSDVVPVGSRSLWSVYCIQRLTERICLVSLCNYERRIAAEPSARTVITDLHSTSRHLLAVKQPRWMLHFFSLHETMSLLQCSAVVLIHSFISYINCGSLFEINLRMRSSCFASRYCEFLSADNDVHFSTVPVVP